MKKSSFNKTIPCTFTYNYVNAEGEDDSEVINVVLKQNSFRESVAAADAQKDEDRGLDYLVDTVADRLLSWDIIDDDTGEPLPTDKDTLGELPDMFLIQLSTAMNEVLQRTNPIKPPLTNLESGSEPAAKLASQTKKPLTTTA